MALLRDRLFCAAGACAEEQAEQALSDSDKGYRSALVSTLKRTRDPLADA